MVLSSIDVINVLLDWNDLLSLTIFTILEIQHPRVHFNPICPLFAFWVIIPCVKRNQAEREKSITLDYNGLIHITDFTSWEAPN